MPRRQDDRYRLRERGDVSAVEPHPPSQFRRALQFELKVDLGLSRDYDLGLSPQHVVT
jgi:hypothetical protein